MGPNAVFGAPHDSSSDDAAPPAKRPAQSGGAAQWPDNGLPSSAAADSATGLGNAMGGPAPSHDFFAPSAASAAALHAVELAPSAAEARAAADDPTGAQSLLRMLRVSSAPFAATLLSRVLARMEEAQVPRDAAYMLLTQLPNIEQVIPSSDLTQEQLGVVRWAASLVEREALEVADRVVRHLRGTARAAAASAAAAASGIVPISSHSAAAMAAVPSQVSAPPLRGEATGADGGAGAGGRISGTNAGVHPSLGRGQARAGGQGRVDHGAQGACNMVVIKYHYQKNLDWS